MPSRHARARRAHDDPINITRNRYMEAIRAGATIEDATDYANDHSMEPNFVRGATVEESAPQVTKHPIKPTPGEAEQLLPHGVVGEVQPPKAVDPDQESIKRPMAAPAAPPAPVSPAKAVSAPVETQASAETKPTVTMMKPPLPADWDSKDFEWPRLRGLCLAMGLDMPNSRGDAVKKIRAKLAADEAAAETPPA